MAMIQNKFRVVLKSFIFLGMMVALSFCGNSHENPNEKGHSVSNLIARYADQVLSADIPIKKDNAPDAFVMIWDLKEKRTIQLPLPQMSTDQGEWLYNFTVDWNDPSVAGPVEVTSFDDNDATRELKPGRYEVRITANNGGQGLPAWNYSKTLDNRGQRISCDGLVGVDSLGQVGWKNLYGAFWGCKDLKYVMGGDTSEVTDMRFMFHEAAKLEHVATQEIDFSSVEQIDGMFGFTDNLKCLDMRGLNLASLGKSQGSMQGMFVKSGVEEISFEGSDLSGLKSLYAVFGNTHALKEVSFKGTDLTNVTSLLRGFVNTDQLEAIDFRGVELWNDSNILGEHNMFVGVPETAKLLCPSGFNPGNNFYGKTCSSAMPLFEVADTTCPYSPIVEVDEPDNVDLPSIRLVLTVEGMDPVSSGVLTLEGYGHIVDIGGTCSPNSVGSIEIQAPSESHNFPLTCDCVNNLISNCVDPNGNRNQVSEFFSFENNIRATITNGANTANHNITVSVHPPRDEPPKVDLSIPSTIDPLEPITISGTCSHDGQGHITLTSEQNFTMTPSGPITCGCQGGNIVNCSSSQIVLSASDTIHIQMAIPSSDQYVSNHYDIEVTPITDLIFGEHEAYWEDGGKGMCAKISPTSLMCVSGEPSGQGIMGGDGDWKDRLVGATIEMVTCTETVCFVVDSAQNVWSWTHGPSTVVPTQPIGRNYENVSEDYVHQIPGIIDFEGVPQGNLIQVQGTHSDTTFLYDSGELWSFTGQSKPVRVASNAVAVYPGPDRYCYLSDTHQLICQDTNRKAPFHPDNVSDQTLTEDVLAYTSNNFATLSKFGSLTVFTDGRVIQDIHGTQTQLPNTINAGRFDAYNRMIVDWKGNTCFINDQGQVLYNGIVQVSMGNDNVGIYCSSNRINGQQNAVLKDGKLYSDIRIDAPIVGGYDDVIDFRGTIEDICLIRATLEIRCYGEQSQGTVENPVLVGTFTP